MIDYVDIIVGNLLIPRLVGLIQLKLKLIIKLIVIVKSF